MCNNCLSFSLVHLAFAVTRQQISNWEVVGSATCIFGGFNNGTNLFLFLGELVLLLAYCQWNMITYSRAISCPSLS